MDKWSDLYCEHETGYIDLKPVKKYWCKHCGAWVPHDELKWWSGDDMEHGLCPGCDSDLVEPEPCE